MVRHPGIGSLVNLPYRAQVIGGYFSPEADFFRANDGKVSFHSLNGQDPARIQGGSNVDFAYRSHIEGIGKNDPYTVPYLNINLLRHLIIRFPLQTERKDYLYERRTGHKSCEFTKIFR